MFKPKIFTIWSDYSKEKFAADFMAGIIVSILAISLSVAFAVSMGVSPEIGLYVSVISSFVIAILGGTYVSIGGPSAVFIVTVAGIMATHGIEGVMISTFIAGIILVLLGLFRLGALIKYLPYPVTVGFMAGTAVVIFTTQVRGFLGLHELSQVPSNFILRWGTYFSNLGNSSLPTIAIGALGLLILILWPKVTKKIPGGLIVLIVTTALVEIFQMPVQTIGSQFTELALAAPRIQLPMLSVETVIYFLPNGLTIAFLCIVMSLLTAVASDTLIGKKHEPNTELIAQGLSNILIGLWGWIPAASVSTRTVANIENGGRTPVSALVHSVVMLVFIVFALPLLRLVPMVTLASMLMMAAYSMSGWRSFVKLCHGPKTDLLVLMVTFILTVMVDLGFAVGIGMVLAVVLHIHDIRKKMKVKEVPHLEEEFPGEVRIFKVSGPLFFGDSTRFLDSIRLEEGLKVAIVALSGVKNMDATAIETLTILFDKCKTHHVRLVITEIPVGTFRFMKKMKMSNVFGSENMYPRYNDAIEAVAKDLRSYHES
ncbi:MAG: SulP family inorganic anion transporter [Lachnospiraceae bacterium]|nr:SulP family inorganic anion transporter [Lachnospiraceae bacterium]